MNPRLPLLLAAICATPTVLAEHSSEHTLETLVVTDTREGKAKKDLAESVSVVDKEEIENVAPSHPSELLNRIPGVHVNNLGGEGHMTAIRQPISTAGVYLFLEDGIPTRPSGFFNHNGLYEVNMPQAAGVEVVRGPGSALYGSDAIGGIINTLTAAPPEEAAGNIDIEHGSHGWRRTLLSGGTSYAPDAGVMASLNATDTEGFRHHDDFERSSLNLRWDTPLTESVKAKSILAWSEIDQSGVSGLNEADYKNNTTTNYYAGDIGRREVYALRLSTELALAISDTELLTVTPYYRDNQMDLMPSWQLTYDPVIYTTAFQSYGLLSKYRLALPDISGEFIAGVDLDYTPSTYVEDQIIAPQVNGRYSSFSYTGRSNYDYDATQTALSPYANIEWQLLEKLRASVGLRHDRMSVDYQDNLDASVAETIGFKKWFRPDDQTNHYQQTSAKLGLIYSIDKNHQFYTNYREAFRAPTAGQLFRSGSTPVTDELKPVTSDSIELGVRGQVDWLNYELALYHMMTADDIVSYIDGGTRRIANAGETQHDGVEVGLGGNFTPEWGFNLAWTYTEQTYQEFSAICSPPNCASTTNVSFNGNDISQAPQTLGNASLSYQPNALRALRLEAEMVHMGDYYTDQTNTQSYDGHNLFNLRGRYLLTEQLELYSRVENITDKLYSTSTSNAVSLTSASALEYRPGNPRTLYIGARYSF
jgi:iron complex outermembrane receptor protein